MAESPNLRPLDYRGPVRDERPGRRIYIETPEDRMWRRRRKLFQIGLAILFAPVAFYFVPNYIKFGKPTGLSPADFVADAQLNGVPVVQAIKAYRRDNGKLPDQLEELKPKYLTVLPGWGADIWNGQLTIYTRYEEEITYDFNPATEGWSLGGPFAKGPIPLSKVTIGPATQPVH